MPNSLAALIAQAKTDATAIVSSLTSFALVVPTTDSSETDITNASVQLQTIRHDVQALSTLVHAAFSACNDLEEPKRIRLHKEATSAAVKKAKALGNLSAIDPAA